MISTHEGRSYTVRSELVDGKHRVGFYMRCASCGREEVMHADPNSPPDIIVKKFVTKGWLANVRNEKGCFCPECLAKPAKEKPEVPVKAEMPRGPTHDQLKRIAEHLRGVFNADDGYYFDELNDHKAADQLGVPWGWVRQVRELLGFEIRVDPEIKALRDDLAALAEMMLTLEKKLDGVEKRRLAS